jgi:hypothetical protein
MNIKEARVGETYSYTDPRNGKRQQVKVLRKTGTGMSAVVITRYDENPGPPPFRDSDWSVEIQLQSGDRKIVKVAELRPSDSAVASG